MRLITNSYLHRVISGQARGPAAAILRGVLRCGEFCYSSAVRTRNVFYDCRILPSHQLPVPVISIGNITAGGTGKTPMARYLATGLAQRGMHPAILMRGYHRSASGISDEQALLADQLQELKIPVHANPDRVAGGRQILQNHPQTDVILLDDGFQHRRLARDIDIVLIDATNPFGFGHVHPRGLLREPATGLRRAAALILTRCEQLNANQSDEITQPVRRYNPNIPIFRSRFIHTGLRFASTSISAPAGISLETLKSHRVFATAAIANPGPFQFSLKNLTALDLPHLWFPDHHDYTATDLAEIRSRAAESGATAIITTEKDWVKLRSLPAASDGSPPIWRLDLDIQFEASDEQQLWPLLTSRLRRPQQDRPPQPHNPGEDQNRQNHPNSRP